MSPELFPPLLESSVITSSLSQTHILSNRTGWPLIVSFTVLQFSPQPLRNDTGPQVLPTTAAYIQMCVNGWMRNSVGRTLWPLSRLTDSAYVKRLSVTVQTSPQPRPDQTSSVNIPYSVSLRDPVQTWCILGNPVAEHIPGQIQVRSLRTRLKMG